jgi:glutathione S-transferase
MQKIVTDRIRPAGQNDPYGVAQAQELLRTAYAMIERDMASKTWAMGDVFTMADCAAAPALWYANEALPLAAHPNAVAYLNRLQERPSFARARREAEPYMKFFPR